MEDTKIYKVPLRRRLPPMIVITILVLFITVVPAFLFFVSLAAIDSTGSIITALCYLIPLTMGILLSFAFVPLVIAYYSTSYLKISSSGLDYNGLPVLRQQATWQDTNEIRTLGNFDYLQLKQATTTGNPVWLWFYRRNSSLKFPYIPLTGLDEWPDGELAHDLRKYAPHLFEKTAVP